MDGSGDDCGPGRPSPLGATADADGVNFAVFSAHAEALELCLFGPGGERRLPFRERTGDIWHLHVGGIGPGTRYGLRAHGRYAPAEGHRFNPAKLLIDPYARALDGGFGAPDLLRSGTEAAPDPRDSAPAMPRSVVAAPLPPLPDTRPRTAWERTVIYEAHPRGLTMQHPGVPDDLKGTFAGLTAAPVLRHLQELGITAIELLPIHAFVDEPHLQAKGLTNYWGYNSAAFFAPHAAYAGPGGPAAAREMVDRFHAAGIEVILDVVYNHSAEGDGRGPTLSFRGLDNASYYRLIPGDPASYVNDTGCGNTLNLAHPAVVRLVMESLRYWAAEIGVDGFRFDLATALARGPAGFDAAGGFLTALSQDPALAGVKLIAEPWDVGPGGYRLGAFPAPMAEWNDRFRDAARAFWRGDKRGAHDLAAGLLGSAAAFDRAGRRPWSSINFVTAHDGFTLADLVAHRRKHNQANREGNRDGHGHNLGQNFGVEGPTADPAILAARTRARRNLLAVTLLAQGVPMLLAGDELGNGQGGNNNAYCQDNPTGWVDWDGVDGTFLGFVRHLIALRHAHPVLRQGRFLHGDPRADGLADAEWRDAAGSLPDWDDPALDRIGLVLRGAADAPPWAEPGQAAFLFVNRGAAVPVALPPGRWRRVLDTDAPDGRPADPGTEPGPEAQLAARSVALFVSAPPRAPHRPDGPDVLDGQDVSDRPDRAEPAP